MSVFADSMVDAAVRFGQNFGTIKESLLDGRIELLIAGQICGGEFALLLVTDICIHVSFSEQAENLAFANWRQFW